MNIESFLISRYRNEFENVINFMRSLVVKNEVEGDEVETISTLDAYTLYQGAFLGNDMAQSYQFTVDDLLKAGFTELRANDLVNDKREIQTLLMQRVPTAIALMNAKRAERVANYTENNPYYRQFCGLPYDRSQYINILNTDAGDGSTVYLHKVKPDTYPLTFSRLYFERDIEKVYADFDYLYLKFIEKPMTPYEIRSKNQFDICYYEKGYLDESELSYWFESYSLAQAEIMGVDYISAFQGTYKAYVNLQFVFLLDYAFKVYTGKKLEKYAVRDYSDTEIYDILDSNNLSGIKTLSIALLRRVIQRLPELKAYTGTNKVINIIFDIVADKSLTVKRYYLQKKYNIDTSGQTELDKERLYDKSVDLVFIEKTTNQGSESMNTLDQEYTYEEIVSSDDTWGNCTQISSATEKMKIKEEMKKILLSKDFNTVMTKYIGLSKIVDMNARLLDLNNKLGVFYQYALNQGNDLSKDTVVFDNIETTALALYAAWCIVYGIIHGASDPDRINNDATIIEGVMKLRSGEMVISDAKQLASIEIDLGNGYTRPLGYYLTEQEIQKYLVRFNYTQATSIQTLFSDYDNNYEILKEIKNKIVNSYNYDEYQVWNTIYNANLTYKTIRELFGDVESYSEYIEINSENFYTYFKGVLDACIYPQDLASLSKRLYEAYAAYIFDASNRHAEFFENQNDAIGGENLTEISILLNQFMSFYNQLFKQDFSVSFDDPVENSLVLLYAYMKDAIKGKAFDYLELDQKTVKDLYKTKNDVDYLELLHYITDTIKSKEEFELILEEEFVSELLRWKAKSFLELQYETFDKYKTKDTTNLAFAYETLKDVVNL